MELDERYLSRSVARVYTFMTAMSLGGVLILWGWQGWRWAVGFALGAAASWLNFRWLKKIVDSLGHAATGSAPKARGAIFLGMRYILLAGAGYVILRSSEINLTAALVGLFVSAAAVTLEILYQLVIYGST
jgi:hypothetical protein